MARSPTLEHVSRGSALLAWAMLLVVMSLGPLAQGSPRAESFITGVGIDHAVAAAQRLVCAASDESHRASGGSHFPVIPSAAFPALGHSRSNDSAADPTRITAARSRSSAQPRAPPHH